jgi:iron(III) transport system ATP-binding protein
MPKLALRQLTKRFGAITAVDAVDLDVDQGEFVSLLGPSGCGKTTTLRMIAGFMPPDGGSIEIDGEAVSTPQSVVPPEKRRMSMIFQSYAIWPNMTVAENVAFGLKIRKLARAEIDGKVGRILGVVRLAGLADRYPAELSGGQQQRVALARAIVVEPQVLLLDEPLSNLDATLREEMRFEIRRLHDEFRITSVYVTHDQAEAMVTSDRIVVMNQGRIEQVDTPQALYLRPRTRFVAGFIGRTNLIEGERDGGSFRFDGFSIPASLLADAPADEARITISVRPHAIALAAGRDASAVGGGRIAIPATVRKRAYLGETWDYQAAPEMATNGAMLRVAAPPRDAFEVNAPVTLTMDASQIAVVRG